MCGELNPAHTLHSTHSEKIACRYGPMKKRIRPVITVIAALVGIGAFALTAVASPLIVICYFGQKRTIQSHLLPRYQAADPTADVAPPGPCPAVSSPP